MADLANTDQALIDRLKVRALNTARITTMAARFHDQTFSTFPPASIEQIEQCETLIGFRLPEIIRQVYLQIGNGGFGPGYGIVGVETGFEVFEATLAENVKRGRGSRAAFDELGWDAPDWRWTDRFIPYGYWGCNVETIVDCGDDTLPIYCIDSTYFAPHSSQTLRQWWLDWLEGRVQQN